MKIKEFCIWDREYGYADCGFGYSTQCGEDFIFNSEGVKENKFRFCYKCGKRIKVQTGVKG